MSLAHSASSVLNSDVIDICTGLKLGQLFLRNMEHVIGSNLPYQETGDAQDKALAATNLGGGILVKHVTGANHVTVAAMLVFDVGTAHDTHIDSQTELSV